MNPRWARKEKLKREKQQQKQNTFSWVSHDEAHIWCNRYSPPPSQAITAWRSKRGGAGSCGKAARFNADSHPHLDKPTIFLTTTIHLRFQIGWGEGYCFVSHFLPCKLPSFHFSTSFVEKSIHENKHSVSSLRVQVNLDVVHVCATLFPRGLIVFTCHICFIPSNVIFPRYWEHLFAPQPWMEVLERVHFPQSLADFFITLQRRRRAPSLIPRWDCS